MSLTPYQQLSEQLEKSSSVLIATKHYANADGLASSIVLAKLCAHLGKKADIVALANTDLYQFLPSVDNIGREFSGAREFIVSIDLADRNFEKLEHSTENNTLTLSIIPKTGSLDEQRITTKQGKFQYDTVITVDTPDLDSLGMLYENNTEFFFETPIINIDHGAGNEQYGEVNIVELTATSTSELLTGYLQENYNDFLNEEIATLLLSGVIEETDSFKKAVVTPKSLTVASQLMALGAKREDIVGGLFQNKSLSVLKLWGRALARIKLDEEHNIYWSLLAKNDFDKSESSEKEVDGVMREFTSHTPKASFIVLLYEKASKDIVIRCRANSSLNLIDTLSAIAPTGAPDNITGSIKGHDILAAEGMVLEQLKTALEKN
ncbi:MAG: hypothetical protein HOJ15_00060 [Candidatus Jacksonbacteria bacterium]|jgi:bifunctional oligoribonuclease and PAP phosphatase NrnA|nr:hypothetical protein [Candidatus Jacksonbacteria bacterium]MBT6034728.1 hypothetical protein [Candidatus Jacksonbacteria bacterium]MBT6300810.1 hypothetical protein [Candidatus Jacksonbacteria bacterium]MBT6757359.1 hypothetical protein [Candidatus Jacksonbacteria bacterium]MBT6955550.1 hypothetical protein [Candidatus Jacksonbacteria bacterium]